MLDFSSPASATEKSVLWIEAFATYRDPAMRHLLHALPYLRDNGWKIKVWCLQTDIPASDAEITILPLPPLPRALKMVYFSVAANLYGFSRWLLGKKRSATIIHATCGHYFGAEVASVHFVNCVWLRKQLSLGFGNWKDVASFLLHGLGAVFERAHWWSPVLRLALPVSDSVGAEVRSRTPKSAAVITLPNAYDETRFNTGVRAERRDIFRKKLGFAPHDQIFAFVSLGHHQRKGFWLAVEGLSRARRETPNLKLLVVGGLPPTLVRLQTRLGREYPGWNEWITFAGQQVEVESYLAAADAFLYPSYFEAFCLAEIEAAAMGLPLLLTRHHGSEMILQDGINGLFLEANGPAIAAAIRRFLELGPAHFQRSIGSGLTRAEYAERLESIYVQRLAASR